MSNTPITGVGSTKQTSAIQDAQERLDAPNGTLALNDDGTGFFKGDGLVTPRQAVSKGVAVCAKQPNMSEMQQIVDDPVVLQALTQDTLKKNPQLNHTDPEKAINSGEVMELDLKSSLRELLRQSGGLENLRKFVESTGSGAIGDLGPSGASKFSKTTKVPLGMGIPID